MHKNAAERTISTQEIKKGD